MVARTRLVDSTRPVIDNDDTRDLDQIEFAEEISGSVAARHCIQ